VARPSRQRTAAQAGTRTATRPRSGTVRPLATARPGVVAHTEFVTKDPKASQAFFEAAFGWNFHTIDRPDGRYAIFRTPLRMGGGLRECEDGEAPRAVAFVEMRDLEEAAKIVKRAGGKVLVPRIDLPEGQGSYFLCDVPGGFSIGVWAPK
jgi:predicted enzyme related to lactoylglutathione lyase